MFEKFISRCLRSLLNQILRIVGVVAHLSASDREVVSSDPTSASWIAEVREHRTTVAASRVPVHSEKFTGINLRIE